MGAWGSGIRDDDFVRDLIGVFEDRLKAGDSVADATKAVTSQFGGAIEDPVDGPLFWIALADMQWTYGGLEASVLEHVKDDFDSGRSLLAWEEDQRGLARRRAALEKFIGKIGAPNPRPTKPPKTIIRAPKFRSGDCLSIQLSDGQFGAAIVLVADHSTEEYGRNLVAVLDYRSANTPTMDVFRQRKIASDHHAAKGAQIAWYLPMGFRSVKNRLEVVGQVEILESDPKDSNFYFRWSSIGERFKR
jgi:hypothetical protein